MAEQARTTVEPDPLHNRVFVSSLVSVLTEVFGSAKDLYHRLKQKSESDDGYNKPKDAEHDTTRDRRDSHSNIIESLGRRVRWSFDRRTNHNNDSEDDLICNAAVQVKSTYDSAYHKVGEPFARGDDLAKVQLQSHIIILQQVLISIHQDLVLSNYLTISSSHSQLIHLVQTVRTTRAAAIHALDLLYQRMLSQPPKKPDADLPKPGNTPIPPRAPDRSGSDSSSSSDTSVKAPSKPDVEPKPKPNPNINKLFCRYALDLQYNKHLPLSDRFDLGGDQRCPHCRTLIAIRPKKAWEVIMETKGQHSRRRRFLVRNVFVVKCHRASDGFACLLCATHGDADTVCRSIAALMEHLWKEHTCEDLERDHDIVAC
ncbi:hypothetical protein OPT61_g7799 [Boeremia exigua]|uniref:Uncharacterized protein n=1 Tax=Boeremia exigua TaxID=749465 RepID=A0ACC2I152_9PLEO|nr:hypothetical protein OPT61_g7799 [Boeremia exigua]